METSSPAAKSTKHVRLLCRLGLPIVGAAVLLLAFHGCDWSGTGYIPGYVSGEGDQICSDFSDMMQATSSRWAVAAWLAGILGTVASVVGGVVGAGKENDKSWRRASGVLLASLGSLMAATSAYSVSRSSAAGDAAAEATSARKKDSDVDRFRACLDARTHWLASRSASLDHTPPPSSGKSEGRAEPESSDRNPPPRPAPPPPPPHRKDENPPPDKRTP